MPHNIFQLNVWQKAIDLCTNIYINTQQFPREETYGLQSQIRRAAVSIPSNIAEGAGRNSDKEFLHFLGISKGSCYELQTQIIIAQRLNFITETQSAEALDSLSEILKMKFKLMEKLKGGLPPKE